MVKLLRYCFLVMTFLIMESAMCYASDNWSKEQKKAFNQASVYECAVDLANTTYDGYTREEFTEIVAANNKCSKDNIETLLKFLGKNILLAFNEEYGKKKSLVASSDTQTDCRILIEVNSITEKAGLDVTITKFYKGEANNEPLHISISDGRWNSFSNLLQENIEELIKEMNKKLFKGKAKERPEDNNNFDPIYGS